MFTFLLLLATHIGFLAGGIWIGYSNAKSSKVEKGIDILKALKNPKT